MQSVQAQAESNVGVGNEHEPAMRDASGSVSRSVARSISRNTADYATRRATAGIAANASMPIRVAPTVHVRLRAGERAMLALPIPTTLHRRDSVSFHLNRALSDALSGAGDGTFMSDDATVPVGVRVPARLKGGVHRVGDLRFWSADGRGERIIIPIELTVVTDTMALLRASLMTGEARAADARTGRDGVTRDWVTRDGLTRDGVTRDGAAPNVATRIRVAATEYVTAAPRSVQLVGVAVPAELRQLDSIAFSVVRAPGAAVNGPRDGYVRSADGRVLLSVSVPSQSLAGRLRVAEVRYVDPRDGSTVIVPVEVLVDAVHAISVLSAAPLTHAVQGRRTTVRLVITNAGNIEDTVRLSLAVPERWRGRVRDDKPIVLAPGVVLARDVELTAPSEQLGTSNVIIHAIRGSEQSVVADEQQRTLVLPVEVLRANSASAFGPALGVSYSAAQQPGQPLMDSWAFTLSGPLAGSVSISATWTQRAVFGTPGLSRIGGGQLFPSLALLHPRWRLDVGNAVADLGDLAGMVRNGRGVSASYNDSTWQFSALLARPYALDAGTLSDGTAQLATRYGGVLAGARLGTVRNGLAWTSTISHLRDPLLMRAQLDAITLGVDRRPRDGFTARGELAWRNWLGDAGAGASAEFANRSDDRDWRVRAAYVPGGSRAFARAQSDVTVTGTQRLGTTRIGFVGYYAADRDDGERAYGDSNATGDFPAAGSRYASRQETRGVAVLPQWRLGQTASLGIEARLSQSESGNVSTQMSTMSQVLGLFTSARIAAITATSSASYTHALRDLQFTDVAPTALDESQLNWTAQLLWPMAHGVFDVYSSLQRRMGAAAISDGQHDVVLRAERLAVPYLDGRVHVSAAVGRSTSLSTGSAVVTQRVGLASSLPFATYLRLDFERNPFVGVRGASGWSTALRIERSFGAPGFLRGGRGTGVVFEDLNGNGVRDGGERGLAGVIVRVGADVMVTDQGGTYRLTRTGGGVPVIDERSLPFGLMIAPQHTLAAVGASTTGSDIAVVPVGSVEVRLELAADSTTSRLPLSWAGVSVAARDATGRRHIARVLPDGRAVFEALPSGVYQLEVDGSAASEPLSVQGVAPSFTLAGQRDTQIVRVLLGPRRVRLFRAEPVRRETSEGSR